MESLDELSRRVRACTDCPLHSGRTNAVPGEGPADAEILLIGEGPGYHEDRQGRPFVGAAGSFLEELLQSVGMSREQVFIANMVKCRPPNNRDPVPAEIAACSKYLDRQIELLNPLLIITLGRFATARFLPGQSISRVRGRLRAVAGRHIFPIMHPAAGLRRQEMRAAIEEDFAKVPGLLDVLRMQAEPPAAAGGAIREGVPAYGAEAAGAGEAGSGDVPVIPPQRLVEPGPGDVPNIPPQRLVEPGPGDVPNIPPQRLGEPDSDDVPAIPPQRLGEPGSDDVPAIPPPRPVESAADETAGDEPDTDDVPVIAPTRRPAESAAGAADKPAAGQQRLF